ncbi:beta-ketoacyl synthase N-terminal-like domain-containing protein, partial [Photorhabdus sp. RM71S]
IASGRDCIQKVSDPDWLHFFERYNPNILPVRYGAMWGIEYFDPLFFRISPMEADAMDVAQRILLEEIYHAFEDA